MAVTNDVRVEVYRSFVEDMRSPSPEEIGERLGEPTDGVRAALGELAEQDVIAFRPGTDELWLAHPFCATDAPFAVTSGQRRWQAICIWDALGILALIEADGRVETACPDCGDALEVVVQDGAVRGPADAIVHFGVRARSWYEDVAHT